MRMLGERLREARVASGLSQAQLGAPYFTRAHVSAIELGKIRPAMRSLEHLARKLGKSPSYFLDDVDAERGRKERELELTAIAGLLTFAEAAEALRRIEKIADGEGLTVRETCRLRLYEGTALDLLHRGRDAIKALTVAQRLARELREDLVGVLIMHNALAVLAADAGRIDAAFAHVSRAIEIAKVSGPAAYLAHCFVTRAEVALKAKDTQLARQSAEEAVATATERGQEADRAISGAALVLAELDLRDGDATRAERRLREAVAIYKAQEAKAELGDAYMRLSRAAKKRGDLRGAERYASLAYAAAKPLSVNIEPS